MQLPKCLLKAIIVSSVNNLSVEKFFIQNPGCQNEKYFSTPAINYGHPRPGIYSFRTSKAHENADYRVSVEKTDLLGSLRHKNSRQCS